MVSMKALLRGVLVFALCGAGLLVRAEDVARPAEGQPWTVPDLGMEFVWIPALKMWVGKYEVTNGEYRKFKPNHDSKDYEGHSLNGDRQPVVYVNFDDANECAAWLTQREKAAGRLPDGSRYRLPAEQEWQTFAQCGDNRTYPWGNDWPPKYGNYCDQSSAVGGKIDGYNDGSPATCPVEKSGRNDWGLYGVGGNVWECASVSSGGRFGAWRGASWTTDVTQDGLRCGVGIVDARRAGDGGFRLVLSR